MRICHNCCRPNPQIVYSLRKDPGTIVNYCEQQFVTQHDLLRQLAINLSSKQPLAERTRLIINAHGEDLPTSISEVHEPMQARILSITTGFVSKLKNNILNFEWFVLIFDF